MCSDTSKHHGLFTGTPSIDRNYSEVQTCASSLGLQFQKLYSCSRKHWLHLWLQGMQLWIQLNNTHTSSAVSSQGCWGGNANDCLDHPLWELFSLCGRTLDPGRFLMALCQTRAQSKIGRMFSVIFYSPSPVSALLFCCSPLTTLRVFLKDVFFHRLLPISLFLFRGEYWDLMVHHLAVVIFRI